MKNLKLGNFDNLANNYAKYRPGYSQLALKIILSIVEKDNIDFVDVGAGTGIWTRIVAADPKIRSTIAVDPSDNMRQEGVNLNSGFNINWRSGRAENTGLETSSCDLLSMASSFHWTDFDSAIKEFSRVLRPGGRFVALWNPRYIKDNPVLIEIENKISELCPNIKRISSGNSQFVEQLADRLNSCKGFEELVYIEARHSVNLTKEQYIGVWNSVNDLQYQMRDKFSEFMEFIFDRIKNLDYIKSTYLTRVWTVKKVG